MGTDATKGKDIHQVIADKYHISYEQAKAQKQDHKPKIKYDRYFVYVLLRILMYNIVINSNKKWRYYSCLR